MDDAALQIGTVLGFVLTLMIYSYLLGDNPLYRLAVHVLVGVGMGYAFVVVIYSVFIPQFVLPFQRIMDGASLDLGEQAQPLVAVLAVFLLLKLSPRTAPFGNLAMGFVMGIGAAVAVSGAVLGTLLPQIAATALPLLPEAEAFIFPDEGILTNVLAVLILVAGTITSLLYFHFSTQPAGEGKTERPIGVRVGARVGQVFLMITFGSLFAGALIASLSVLTDRMQFYIQWLGGFFT